jgi:hypothetical protein
MAKYISIHARYRLAATAFAVIGGLLCLGALIFSHETTLLVAGMISLATSMLFMSLRPVKEAVRETAPRDCGRCPRGDQTTELTVRKLRMSEPPTAPLGRDVEHTTDTGARRPRERKTPTWSI